MPLKKTSKKIKIRTVSAKKPSTLAAAPVDEEKFQIISERRILDEKLLRSSSQTSLGRIIGLVLVLGLLLGGGVLFYLMYTKSAVEPVPAHNIIIPESSTVPVESPPTANPAQNPTVPEPRVELQQVLIQDTPNGFLNVRSGPGTNFAKIGKVKPGETYELVSQDQVNGGWYQIRLDANRTGWVTRAYANIK